MRPSATERPKVLAFAYACEPEKGSEPGAGWTWVRMLATFADVVVLTRANNREGIESALETLDERDHLLFVYTDLPLWARRWKRAQRGVRLYYLLWQIAALRAARGLARERSFDLYWHLTFANGWLGTLAPLAGRPFVYGPIGGGTSAPWRLLPSLGLRGALYEVVRSIARGTARYGNPLARLAWAHADLILAQNPETLEWLPRSAQVRAVVFPNATLEAHALRREATPGTRNAVFAGRLLPLKGIALALRALAATDDWTLTICGDGPDRERLVALARRLGIEGRVTFAGWRQRTEVLDLLAKEADVFLFPSLHDEAPLAVVDALACGVPVICFPIGAARILGGPAATVVDASGSATSVVARLALVLDTAAPERVAAISRALELTVGERAARLADVLVARGLLPPVVDRLAA